ncbi:hypothetical protein J3458_021222 [Metarhizium acridum]|uniref:uncharacterized protein n=1 Tax=Metarhizium acridum TaxID=92637 RepID=UPI001C6CD691|nr:hypothetical protein J3458_021222 [Metarhizium acridum]
MMSLVYSRAAILIIIPASMPTYGNLHVCSSLCPGKMLRVRSRACSNFLLCFVMCAFPLSVNFMVKPLGTWTISNAMCHKDVGLGHGVPSAYSSSLGYMTPLHWPSCIARLECGVEDWPEAAGGREIMGWAMNIQIESLLLSRCISDSGRAFVLLLLVTTWVSGAASEVGEM